MKKIICVMVCILVFVQSAIGILSESNNEIKELSNLELKYCESFSLPDNESINNPERVYEILKATANEHKVNIFRSVLEDGEDGKYEVVKYVFLAGESNYYNEFEIIEGQNFNEKISQSEINEQFISTRKSGNKNQIGIIKSHIYNMNITIRTLNQQADYYKESGLYYVELSKGVTREKFINDLKKNLENEFGIEMQMEEFQETGNIGGLPYIDSDFFIMLELVTIFLIIICVFYYYFRKSKEISVLNLFGISNGKSTILLQKEFHILYLSTLLLIAIVVSLYSRDIVYTWQVMKLSIILYIALFTVIYFAGVFFSRFCNVRELLLGKNSTKCILYLNYIMKIICLIIALYIGESIYVDYKDYEICKKNYESWECADEYGVFYPYYIGFDTTYDEQYATEIIINNQLYNYLNQKGAIYVDASVFEKDNLEINGMPDIFESIKVNPNYLNVFPVLDENGKTIEVSEEESDWILLVPKKYKKDEEEILSLFYEDRQGQYQLDEEEYCISVSSEIKSQKIKIVWIKDNQEIFSFNPNVYPEDSNMIKNTIIQVVTENNSCTADKQSILGNGTSDPLKVKLDGNSKETYDKLQTIIESLDLQDNLKHLVSANEEAAQILKKLNANIKLSFMMLLVLLMVWILISAQSVLMIFDNKRMEFIVKRISGWNWKDIYGKYVQIESIVLIVITLLYAFANPIMNGDYKCLIFIDIFIWLMEMLIFKLCIKYSEKKKIIDTLKGES